MHDSKCRESVTNRLIEHLREIDISRLSAGTTERAIDLIVDHVGVSLYGATFEWCQILRNQGEREGGVKESTIYGGGLATARNAAMINGVAAHAIELDDTHDESLNHPGCVIIPAALAMAEAINASGEAFLAAVIAGYEAQCRIGSVVGRHLVARGLHPTAQVGAFGATAAAACLLSLPRPQFHCAFGLAASMTSGIMKFADDPAGTMVKRLHAGMPAERGILAARLAAEGFTGPRDSLEGEYGYAKSFADVEDLSRVMRGLGEDYEIEKCSIKLYPCCRMFHSLIEAIAICRNDPAFELRQVEAITAFGPSNMVNGHMTYRPDSVLSAQYSLPYAVAVALVSDPSRPQEYSTSAIRRPDLLAVSDKVTAKIDPNLELYYPAKFPARVELRMKNGATIVNQLLDSLSTPARPIGRTDIVSKFRKVTASVLDERRQEKIVETIHSIAELDSIRSLTELLRHSENRQVRFCETGVPPAS